MFILVKALLLSVLVIECFTHHVRSLKLEVADAEGVVPELISKFPEKYIHLSFDKKEIHAGEELTPTQVKSAPEVSYENSAKVYYTLLMVDPDAPSRQNNTLKWVKHWLVVNIPGDNVAKGTPYAEYLGSGPPKGTGLHRYFFFLYQQREKLEFNEPKSGALSRDHRLKFNVKSFVQKYGLGEPIAANYFKAQWDQYVDQRNEQIAKQTRKP